jgi:hypothetical protein
MQHLHGNTKMQLNCSSKVKIMRFSELKKQNSNTFVEPCNYSYLCALCLFSYYSFHRLMINDMKDKSLGKQMKQTIVSPFETLEWYISK